MFVEYQWVIHNNYSSRNVASICAQYMYYIMADLVKRKHDFTGGHPRHFLGKNYMFNVNVHYTKDQCH